TVPPRSPASRVRFGGNAPPRPPLLHGKGRTPTYPPPSPVPQFPRRSRNSLAGPRNSLAGPRNSLAGPAIRPLAPHFARWGGPPEGPSETASRERPVGRGSRLPASRHQMHPPPRRRPRSPTGVSEISKRHSRPITTHSSS